MVTMVAAASSRTTRLFPLPELMMKYQSPPLFPSAGRSTLRCAPDGFRRCQAALATVSVSVAKIPHVLTASASAKRIRFMAAPERGPRGCAPCLRVSVVKSDEAEVRAGLFALAGRRHG